MRALVYRRLPVLLALATLAACTVTPRDDGDGKTTDRTPTPGRGTTGNGGTGSATPGATPGTPGTPGATTPITPGTAPTTPTTPGATAPTDKIVLGYYTAWSNYARKYPVTSIPAAQLTHINYGFANLNANGECVLGDEWADTGMIYGTDSWGNTTPYHGHFYQLNLLKKQNPKLKTLISVGGWTWSTHFSTVAADATKRATMAKSCGDFMRKYDFDGIDIDWEYPGGGGLDGNSVSPADGANYALLLQALRADIGDTKLLTIASPAGTTPISTLGIDKGIAQYLNLINVMTYDFHGGWEKTSNFNAPLYAAPGDPSPDPIVRAKFNADSALKDYLARGVDPKKLIMGVPFYGRGWQGVGTGNNGLFQAASGPAAPGSWEAGVFDYKDVVTNYLAKGYTRHWNAQSKVPWLFNPATGVMISYDDPESIKIKAQYAKQQNLGGVMIWDLSSDAADVATSLLTAVHDGLK